MSFHTQSFARGIYPPGIIATFGAAATAANLLRLPRREGAQALALAATQAAGLYSPTMVKRFNIGRGASSGLLAAFLAQESPGAPLDILEREHGGFWGAFSQGDQRWVLDGLGEYFHMADVAFKFYPVARGKHPVIELVQRLRRESGATALSVRQVRIFCTSQGHRWGAGYDVNDPSAALMSYVYSAAIALVHDQITPELFREEVVRDPQIQDLMRRATVTVDPSLNALPVSKRDTVRIELVLEDGRRFEGSQGTAKGYLENPLTEEELLRKFTDVTSQFGPQEQIARLRDQVLNLETLPTVDGLVAAVTGILPHVGVRLEEDQPGSLGREAKKR
jgi:2-methylcitrate dehydratase PrpD